jgi:hypothetical protein
MSADSVLSQTLTVFKEGSALHPLNMHINSPLANTFEGVQFEM